MGRAKDEIFTEVLDRALDYESWFLRSVDEGNAAIDRGEYLDHDDVVAEIEAFLRQ
jgi:predicted transcriptional regulator